MAHDGFKIDVDVPKVVTIGVVSMVLFAVILIATHGFFMKMQQAEFAAKNYTQRGQLLLQLDDSKEMKDFYTTRPLNDQTVAVDINTAIRLMAASKGRPPTTQPLGPG